MSSRRSRMGALALACIASLNVAGDCDASRCVAAERGDADRASPANAAIPQAQHTVPVVPNAALRRALPSLDAAGTRLAWVETSGDGCEIWTAAVASDRVLSKQRMLARLDGAVVNLGWARNVDCIVAATRNADSGNGEIFAIDAASGTVTARMPEGIASAELLSIEGAHSGEILVRATTVPRNVFRVRLDDGGTSLVLQDDLGAASYGFDGNWIPRIAIVERDDGSRRAFLPSSGPERWTFFRDWAPDAISTLALIEVSRDGSAAYLIDDSWPESAGLAALVKVDLSPATERRRARVLAASTRWTPHTLVTDRATGEPIAAVSSFDRDLWKAMTSPMEEEIAAMRKLRGGDFRLVSRSDDDQRWLLMFSTLGTPQAYWLWDRASRQGSMALAARSDVNVELVTAGGYRVRMRDGLELPVFVTMPPSVELEGPSPRPTVILVRDGLWERAQQLEETAREWFARQGVVVLSVVARGSRGLSPAIGLAGRGSWMSVMGDDFLDVIDWASRAGFTIPTQVSIAGDGLGGSVALAVAAHAPERFASVVAINPTLDFRTIPRGTLTRSMIERAVDSSDDAVLLRESPGRVAPRLAMPSFLVLGGAMDGSIAETDDEGFAAELQALGRQPRVHVAASGRPRLDVADESLVRELAAFLDATLMQRQTAATSPLAD